MQPSSFLQQQKDFTVGPNQAPADLDFTIKSEVVMGHIEATAQLFAVESGSHVNAASGGPYDMRASGGFTNLRQPNRKASGGSYGAPEGCVFCLSARRRLKVRNMIA